MTNASSNSVSHGSTGGKVPNQALYNRYKQKCHKIRFLLEHRQYHWSKTFLLLAGKHICVTHNKGNICFEKSLHCYRYIFGAGCLDTVFIFLKNRYKHWTNLSPMRTWTICSFLKDNTRSNINKWRLPTKMQLPVVLSFGTGMQTSQPRFGTSVTNMGKSNVDIKIVYCNFVSICTFEKAKLQALIIRAFWACVLGQISMLTENSSDAPRIK